MIGMPGLAAASQFAGTFRAVDEGRIGCPNLAPAMRRAGADDACLIASV
jgi:hypothetical protein